MTAWRWLGSLVMLAGLMVLVGANLSVTAQDKGKKADTGKKDASAKDKSKTDAEKKTDNKTDDSKKTQPKDEPGKTRLAWKMFDPKTVTYQTLVTNTTQDMKVMGQDISQKQSQTFYLKWTAEDKNKDGNYVVTQEIIGLKMTINIGGTPIAYDSTADKQPANPMTDFFKTLVGMKLKLTISPKMEVVGIEGQDEFVKKLSSTNPQMETLLKSILSPDALKQMAEPTWGALPDHAVAKGDTWGNSKKPSVLDLGPIGKYTTTFTYTYEGEEKGMDKIGIKAELKYNKPDPTAKSLPFTIKDANLASTEGSGVALFDRAKGRFAETDMKMTLKGDLTIEVGGMETKVALVQNQDAKMTTSDQPPAAIAASKK